MTAVLPRKGEVDEAKDVLNARIQAWGVDPEKETGRQAEPEDIALVFGDLFDADDMQRFAAGFSGLMIRDLLRGTVDVAHALATAFGQGAALGVMIERRRWEAEERERRRAA